MQDVIEDRRSLRGLECVLIHTVLEVAMPSREVIARIETAGWVEKRQTGSHKQFRHAILPGTVTVPHPSADLAVGTLKSIEKQSGVKLR